MAFVETLDAECDKLGLRLTENQRKKLHGYWMELEHWKQRINLTSLKGAELMRRLVAEPTWIGAHLGIGGTMMDIGSGNGSPAIPLTITRPLESVHLVESRMKRSAFLRHLKAKLELRNVSVHCTRIEDAVFELENVDWITIQAVALTRSLLENLRRGPLATAKIVWITAHGSAPTATSCAVRIPGTTTEAWIFKLDHS